MYYNNANYYHCISPSLAFAKKQCWKAKNTKKRLKMPFTRGICACPKGSKCIYMLFLKERNIYNVVYSYDLIQRCIYNNRDA